RYARPGRRRGLQARDAGGGGRRALCRLVPRLLPLMESLAWIAKNLVATLILPPASLLIRIALGLWFGSRRGGRWLAGTSLVVLTLLSIPAVGILLGTPFERAYPPLDLEAMKQRPKENMMVVILGGGRDLGGVEYPEGERLNDAS